MKYKSTNLSFYNLFQYIKDSKEELKKYSIQIEHKVINEKNNWKDYFILQFGNNHIEIGQSLRYEGLQEYYTHWIVDLNMEKKDIMGAIRISRLEPIHLIQLLNDWLTIIERENKIHSILI